MMLVVKLFIDPFISCPSLLVVLSCLGLRVHLKGFPWGGGNLEPAMTFNFLCFTLKSDRNVRVLCVSGVFSCTLPYGQIHKIFQVSGGLTGEKGWGWQKRTQGSRQFPDE